MEHRSLKTQKREIERLVKKAQEGDEDAFAKLYDLFANPLYRYVYFRCNGADPEDLLATIFTKIWANLKQYTFQDNSFSAWAYRIAHNVVVDHYRDTSHMQEHEVSGLDERMKDSRRENSAKYLAEHGLNKDLVKKALAGLDAHHQQIIILKFLNELENDEIAEILGKSLNNVRILQHRALKALRMALFEMGITDLSP